MFEDLVKTEREVTRFRLIAFILLSVGFLLRRPHIELTFWLLILAYLAVYALIRLVLFPRFPSRVLVFTMIFLDVVAITVLLRFSGGINSLFFILYPISIIYSSFYYGYSSATFAAILVTIGYGIMILWEGREKDFFSAMVAQMPLIYVLAGLSGWLVQRQIAERREKEALAEMVQIEAGAKEVLEATKNLLGNLELQEVLPTVARTASQVTGLARCFFALIVNEEEGTPVAVGTAANLSPAALGIESFDRLRFPLTPGSLATEALEQGRPIAVTDVSQDRRFPRAVVTALGLSSALVVPLLLKDKRIGLMILDNGGKPHTFSEREITQAQRLADQAAIAVSNAQLYAEAQEKIQNLVGEVRAVVQRREGAKVYGKATAINLDGLEINVAQRRVKVNGQVVNLSWTEFELLHFMVTNSGVAFTRETLFRKVWKQEYYISTNLVDVCVHRLRQKIEEDPSSPKRIITVHGVGYMFADTREGKV